MERLPFELNGNDYSDCVDHSAYTVTYEKRTVNNGGMMLDGSITEDLLCYKAVVKIGATALPSDRMSQLVSDCLNEYVTLKYFDTMTNMERTATFVPSLGDVNVLINSTINGLWWNKGAALTLRER